MLVVGSRLVIANAMRFDFLETAVYRELYF